MYLRVGGRGTAVLLEVGLGPISQPIGPQPFRGRVLGRSLGGHFPPVARQGPPGFLERTRKRSRGGRGWDFWLYPAGLERLDVLTSGEEVLRSVGFSFYLRL